MNVEFNRAAGYTIVACDSCQEVYIINLHLEFKPCKCGGNEYTELDL